MHHFYVLVLLEEFNQAAMVSLEVLDDELRFERCLRVTTPVEEAVVDSTDAHRDLAEQECLHVQPKPLDCLNNFAN